MRSCTKIDTSRRGGCCSAARRGRGGPGTRRRRRPNPRKEGEEGRVSGAPLNITAVGGRLVIVSSFPPISPSVYLLTMRMAIQDDDSFFGVDLKTSTRFDRNFGITEFLKTNLGTEVAYPLVSCRRFGTIRGVCCSQSWKPAHQH